MADEEEDFMSDKFLQQAAESDTVARKANSRQAKSAAGIRKPSAPQTKPVPTRVKEQENRDVGLSTPVGSDTKGFKMMLAMGYTPGQSVGTREGGLVEPIELPSIKREKTGLGAVDTETRKKREREEVEVVTKAKREKIEAAFLHTNRSKFEEKKVNGRLIEAVRICRQLDEAKGVKDNLLLKEFADAEARPVEEAQLPVTLWGYITSEMSIDDRISKMVLLLDYLRSDHWYCIFCGTSYHAQGDMDTHCPGPMEEDHN